MAKKWFNVQAQESATGKAGVVSIRGMIGEWGITDRELIAEVEALGEIQNLTVRINSRGGEVDHAVGIFNFLRDHPADIHVVVDGVAMSSGSLIAMAGDKITMRSNSVMMIHNPWTYAAGNAKQLRAQADILEKFETALAAVYVARTGKSEEDIKAMLDGPEGDGIYMTAAEALAEGFADEVEPVAGKGASAMAMASALGIPADVLAKIEAAESEGDGTTAPDASGSPALCSTCGHDNSGDVRCKCAEHVEDNGQTVTDQINAVIVNAGFADVVSVFLLDDAIKTVNDAKAAVAIACEVRALCNAAGKPDEAARLVKERATLADARKHLTDILADADEKTHVDSTRPSSNSKPAKTAQPAALKTADVWAARRKTIH